MTMRASVLLALALSALPASPSDSDYRVELFSNRRVSGLVFTALDRSVALCEVQTRGPCVTLKPGVSIHCSADRGVRCRGAGISRSFRTLTATSGAPFRLSPEFTGVPVPGESVRTPNARITAVPPGLQVITAMDLEAYVSGVLRGEAAVMRAPAARQAMAILARTWARRWQGRHAGRGFDFCSLTHCQVFRLAFAEARSMTEMDPAARDTKGQVLVYHGAMVDPYFTACCGGMTEAAANVWPDRAEPYLNALRDPYCVASPHAFWRQSITREDFSQVLRKDLHLPITAPLSVLSVAQRDSSGRAIVLQAVAGGTWDIDANRFRYALNRRFGWQQIKSNLYTLEPRGDSWVFSGHGLGHGVGLCQAGAEQMAQSGASTARILDVYFPGTEVTRFTDADDDPVASSEHFQLIYIARQQPWVKQTLDTLEHWRTELGTHAQFLPPRVRVQASATTADFIRATGEPGWMAASSDGQSIVLQPLDLLARRHILDQTLRHELTHLAVHRSRAQGIPTWFEEGCVLFLAGEKIEVTSAAAMAPNQLENAVTHPASEAQMKTAYAQALERVRRLVRETGESGLWRVLDRPTAADLHNLANR